METALQKGLICVICMEVKTKHQVCRQCFNTLVAGQQAKPETLVVLALKHLLGETIPFSQGVHLSEFRQDYLRLDTIPSHPLATYAMS